MIVYYVEGHEGHTMLEEVGRAQFRTAVRGQCFSFMMPWSLLIKELNGRMSTDDLAALPRNESCLQYLLRFHLRVAGRDFDKELKQVCLRPCVLVHLIKFMVEQGHEAFRRSGRAHALVERIEEAVHARYPETEAHLPEAER